MESSSYDYIRLMLNGLARFQREGILCDTIFQLHDGEVSAHSVVLASVSRKLRPVFIPTDPAEQAAHHRIEMPDFNSDDMNLMLKYVYTGEKGTPSTPSNLVNVISLFETLEIPAPLDWIVTEDCHHLPGI